VSGLSKIAKLSVADRLATAKVKTERVVGHLLYVLELHENNEIIVYSDILSAQIPTSYAANAFIIFRHGFHQFEIVRLCALWDSVELEKENITTIVELIDHPEVIDRLAEEAAAPWKHSNTRFFNPSDDPSLNALEIDAIRRSDEEFGDEQAQRARRTGQSY
jgi:hypothetical protein